MTEHLMDSNVYQTDAPLRLEMKVHDGENKAASTTISLASLDDLNGREATWTKANIFQVSVVSVLMLLTVLGNAIVITTIISCAELRKKRVNIFILGLSVGDLVVCFVSMPSHILLVIFGQWVLGIVACKLTGYLYLASVAFTIFLLTAMTIDRYQALVQPLKFLGGRRCVRQYVLVSWMLAAVVAIPQLVAFVQIEDRRVSSNTTQDMIVYKCSSAGYTAKWQRKLYVTFVTTSLLLIPACIMIYCFESIIRVVWLRAGAGPARNIDQPLVHFVSSRRSEATSDSPVCLAELGSQDQRSSPQLRRRSHSLEMDSYVAIAVPRRMTLTTKRSVIRMAISVTVGFMVCWTPHFVITLVRVYSDYQCQWTAAKSIGMLMALSHSAVNPFLYIIFTTRAVRAAFIHLCQRAKLRCCQRL